MYRQTPAELLERLRRNAEQCGADAARSDRNSHDRAYAAGRRDAYSHAADMLAPDIAPDIVDAAERTRANLRSLETDAG